MHEANASTSSPIRSRISIRFKDVEGALIRTLMTLGRRGWSVVTMQAHHEGGRLLLDAELEATALGTPMPPCVLERQLARLHDVHEVFLEPSQPEVRKELVPC